MDLMSLTARDLSSKCLEAFRKCSTFRSPGSDLSNQHASQDERFEYRLADFNLWIDGIGALAPSKASLDARLSERPIDLSLVKGNLVMLFQSLEDCLDLLKNNGPLEDALLDIDSALESLVSLSLAIRKTGRRSRLHKADRLFKPEEHAELKKHMEAIIVLRPGSGPCSKDDEFQTKMQSLTPLQNHLITANLKRRNRFIQAQLHSLGLKKRIVGFELPVPETTQLDNALAPSPEDKMGKINTPPSAPTLETPIRPLSVPMSVTSASIPEKVGEDISSIISSSAQTRMGIESCPFCEVNGEVDSPELIDHVLEHVHDFSLRSLPWPRSSEVDMGGEVGYFNLESGEPAVITEWLDAYEHEMEDIDPNLKLSACDYGRLAIITEQMSSDGGDKLGLDIGFADEHDGESAEAETDISQLTQETLESVKQARDVICCHECEARWYRNVDGMQCPKCQSEFVEIVEPESGSESSDLLGTVMRPGFATIDSRGGYVEDRGYSSDATGSKPNTRESIPGFRRFTDRLFSRKKPDNTELQKHTSEAANNLIRKSVANQKAWKILISIYHRRLESPTNTKSMFANFIRDVQNEDIPEERQPVSDLHLPPKDLTKPISNYFINSSHRTLIHTLADSHNAIDAINEALYFGYRSIDLDVWNGTADGEERDPQAEQPRGSKPGQTAKTLNHIFGLDRESNAQKHIDLKTTVSQRGHMSSPTEPIVTDGFTLMTPCDFREACQAIRDSAFINTDLPVIVNLVVHTDSGQQDLMVNIMKEEWSDVLIDKPIEGCDPRFRLPTLEDLRGRILVSLETITTPSFVHSGGFDEPGERLRGPGRGPIIQPLADLGVYLRREKF
ncbi:1-phosphatidylinositol-4 5-bisphosphate phosphodiesterase [Fusarium coicis]|nr:1-phosphatidylinositol-4 5-bisphosphate phosphodiesterase [Fusarium coicis]